MRYRIAMLSLAALLGACGGEQEPQTVQEKEQKIVDYRKQVAELNKKIGDLEASIKAEKGGDPSDAYRTVEFMPLMAATFEHYVEVQGTVDSDKNVQVFPKMPGTIVSLKVQEGQQVSAGQAIAELDAAQLRKAIEEIETRLELAKAVYERQNNLWQQKIGSEVQFLQAKNNMEALQKSLATQREALDNAVVRAPISGTLDEFFQNAGEMANPAMPIARVVNLAAVEVSAEVSEAYTKAVRRGDAVQVSFPSIGQETQARIDLVGQTINPKNRTFRIEIKLPNPQGYLKPNAMAVVKIKDFAQQDAISIPAHVLQQSTNGERFVYVLREHEGHFKVVRITVEVGQSYKGMTLIAQGLKAGDKLVVKGYNEIIDGEPVKGLPQGA